MLLVCGEAALGALNPQEPPSDQIEHLKHCQRCKDKWNTEMERVRRAKKEEWDRKWTDQQQWNELAVPPLPGMSGHEKILWCEWIRTFQPGYDADRTHSWDPSLKFEKKAFSRCAKGSQDAATLLEHENDTDENKRAKAEAWVGSVNWSSKVDANHHMQLCIIAAGIDGESETWIWAESDGACANGGFSKTSLKYPGFFEDSQTHSGDACANTAPRTFRHPLHPHVYRAGGKDSQGRIVLGANVGASNAALWECCKAHTKDDLDPTLATALQKYLCEQAGEMAEDVVDADPSALKDVRHAITSYSSLFDGASVVHHHLNPGALKAALFWQFSVAEKLASVVAELHDAAIMMEYTGSSPKSDKFSGFQEPVASGIELTTVLDYAERARTELLKSYERACTTQNCVPEPAVFRGKGDAEGSTAGASKRKWQAPGQVRLWSPRHNCYFTATLQEGAPDDLSGETFAPTNDATAPAPKARRLGGPAEGSDPEPATLPDGGASSSHSAEAQTQLPSTIGVIYKEISEDGDETQRDTRSADQDTHLELDTKNLDQAPDLDAFFTKKMEEFVVKKIADGGIQSKRWTCMLQLLRDGQLGLLARHKKCSVGSKFSFKDVSKDRPTFLFSLNAILQQSAAMRTKVRKKFLQAFCHSVTWPPGAYSVTWPNGASFWLVVTKESTEENGDVSFDPCCLDLRDSVVHNSSAPSASATTGGGGIAGQDTASAEHNARPAIDLTFDVNELVNAPAVTGNHE